jgi:hypothetical protein
MINLLGSHVNKIVLVSIPFLFKDDDPRPCRLVAAETSGLWLEGAELTKRLFPDVERRTETVVFIPFTQIAYLVEDTPQRLAAEHPHHEDHSREKQKARVESSVKKRG